MLYILECMALAILNMYGGTDRIMFSTGEHPTWKEVGVCTLGWEIVFLIGIFIAYSVRYLLKKKKNLPSKKNEFLLGFLYVLECMGLGILCLRGGRNRKMYSTGEKATSKEIVYCVIFWLLLALMVASICLILIY